MHEESDVQSPERLFEQRFGELVRGRLLRRWDGRIRRLPLKKHFDALRAIPAHVEPSRLELFVDAVFAIVATVLYLPLMSTLTEGEAGRRRREDGASPSQLTIGILALVSYILVVLVHMKHLKIGFCLSRDDRITQLCQLLVVFLAALLPYCNTLVNVSVAHWTVCLFGSVLALLGLLFLCWWLYLDARPALQRHRLAAAELNGHLAYIGLWTLLSVLAASLTWALPDEYAALAMLVFAPLPLLRALTDWLCRRVAASGSEPPRLTFSGHRVSGFCAVERLVVFSDAVLAFSATLISADLSVSPLDETPREIIAGIAPQLVAFVWCLAVIAAVWLAQSTIVRTIERVPSALFWSNVLLVGMSPTLAFGCKFAMLAFMRDGSHAHRRNAMFCLGASHLLIAVALLWMHTVVGRRKRIWRSGFRAAWRSQSWYNEAVVGFAGFAFLSLLAVCLAAPAPSAALALLAAATPLLLLWLFLSSFIVEEPDHHEKHDEPPLDDDCIDEDIVAEQTPLLHTQQSSIHQELNSIH